MASELTKTKRKRTTKKNIVLNNIVPSCQAILVGEKNDDTIEEAETLLATLIEKVAEVKSLDEQVSDLLDDDAEYEQNEKDAYDFDMQTRKFEGKLHAFINKPKDVKPRFSGGIGGFPLQQPGLPQSQRVKLPRLEINKFDGDATKWRTFIDVFEATVDARPDISNVEKFSYLHGLLIGCAL